ncbi:MAG: Lrp/AsnC family transcriptional regulator [Actinomycetota bacterium]
MDDIDRKIIEVLAGDGRLPATELSRRVGLSTSATNERLRRLTASPVIRRFTVEIDQAAVGRPMTVFIDLRLRRDVDKSSADAALLGLEQIVDARHVTGRYDYQLQAAATDVEDLDRLLERLRDEAGADETMTRLALRTVPGFPRPPTLPGGGRSTGRT